MRPAQCGRDVAGSEMSIVSGPTDRANYQEDAQNETHDEQ
jgi:hypothetical protein